MALSGGSKKGGHIPYRDSKLTRILQHSLGGNARTAIICTMSPAHSHVEQSRNTLAFATRAKEVVNTTHINMVRIFWSHGSMHELDETVDLPSHFLSFHNEVNGIVLYSARLCQTRCW